MTKLSRRCAFCMLVLCAVLAFAVLAAGLPHAYKRAAAEKAQLSEEVVLEDMYLVGTELTLPASGLVWQGQTYAAERLLHFSCTPQTVLAATLCLADIQRSNIINIIEGVRYGLPAAQINAFLKY